MAIDFLREVFQRAGEDEAIIWKEEPYSYAWLLRRLDHWRGELKAHRVPTGAVVLVEGDFSPNGVALCLALIEHACTFVPLTTAAAAQRTEFIETAEAEFAVVLDEADETTVKSLGRSADHEYYGELRQRGHAGLLLFSSGSTGKSKAAVHDLVRLLEKFRTPRHTLRTISFLLYDHIGGLNTLLYTLSNGGCLVTVQDRGPENVLRTVEEYGVQLLPVTPTFLNLVLLSEAHMRHDLSSLKTVTYGTEPMPQSTLERFHAACPHVRLLQTYGLSELGILRSHSRSSDSLWVKVGGEGFETRIVDGILHIRAQSAMLGYLNAPSPFDEDGWMNTGDAVEVDGEYIRILGRKSEIINVGGEKVHPTEVESLIQEMDAVAEVTVYGEKNAILGNIVCARVRLREDEDRKAFSVRLKKFCKGRLQPYKVPVKVSFDDQAQYSDRFKKRRTGEG
jgi:long-chain acyl-CoA synthetase